MVLIMSGCQIVIKFSADWGAMIAMMNEGVIDLQLQGAEFL